MPHFNASESACGAITHRRLAFSSLDDDLLRNIGFSRQKTTYVRALAECSVITNRFDFECTLLPLSDERGA
jgi:3-methyladenine DNA glycosylase/8-oxoguanine DNA glycosylase